mgnify:FL=1|tara:strand:+ start:780 stop:1487 length:708 start_codon:yes stop_codon:yes gene_type:complete
MPLPILETPTYELTIPSTKKVVEYRPFLVKEEKFLLVAQESDSQKDMLRAMKKLVDVCLFGKVDVNVITLFDLEYIFMKLRSKSVGETTTLKPPCEKCEEGNEITVNLGDIEVLYPKNPPSKIIKFNDTVGVNLRHIGVKDLDKVSGGKDTSIDESFTMIKASIESIFDEDAVYPTCDQSPKEMDKFVDSMNHQQLEMITEFIAQSPKLSKAIEFTCTACKHKNKAILEGSDAFF